MSLDDDFKVEPACAPATTRLLLLPEELTERRDLAPLLGGWNCSKQDQGRDEI